MKDEEGGAVSPDRSWENAAQGKGDAFPVTDSCSPVIWLLCLCFYSSLARYLKIRYNGCMIILHRWIHFILY